MQQLAANGVYEVNDSIKKALQSKFYGDYAKEADIKKMIHKTFEQENYLIDTHTAAAAHVYERYQRQTGDSTPTVILSTANAYKFADNVLSAIAGQDSDSFEALRELEKVTKVPMHPALKKIEEAKLLHTQVCDKEEIIPLIENLLKEGK